MGKLFGTDGIRGIVGKDLGCALALNVGKAAARALGKGNYVIARDTRISSGMLSSALTAGIVSMGENVTDLGVLPTPGLEMYVRRGDYNGGIMISASHNPGEYNGIKMIDRKGCKLSKEKEEEIERMLFEAPYWRESELCGSIFTYKSAPKEYAMQMAASIDADISDLDIAIDCANGAVCNTAAILFEYLGSHAVFLNDKPDGMNINYSCGSTDMAGLCAYVKENHLDCGIAFDGDGDRCLFADERGRTVDGDVILGLCAKDMKSRGILKNKTIVATVMSNSGLSKYCSDFGVRTLLCDVGDRNVADTMLLGDSNLGGEASGHIIFGDHSRHGDGLFTALQMLSVIKRRKQRLSELVNEIPRYPQVEKTIRISQAQRARLSGDSRLKDTAQRAEKRIGEAGRVVVRLSGTEPCIRIMVQGKDRSEVEDTASEIENEIKNVLE